MNMRTLFDDIEGFESVNQEDYDDLRITLEQLQGAVVWGTDWTSETIVSQIKKGLIDLNPKFQRREAWDDKRKSVFIESVISGLPIPQIILAEKQDKKGSYIVIDGKQRLLSLRRFFSHTDDNTFPPLTLRGLELLPGLNGKNYDEISNNIILNSFISQVENQPIRTIVIKNWPNEEFLYNVFLRLNTGSLPLSTQELRQALHPGDFIDFCDEFSITSLPIQAILNIRQPDYRMRDVELVVRYFAFKYFINQYQGNLKSFFDTTVKELNQRWEQDSNEFHITANELNEAINFTYTIFGGNAFKKWKYNTFDTRFNRAIYDIMVYYFSNPVIRAQSQHHMEEIKDCFIQLCNNDILFLSSFETSTKNIAPTTYRFQKWGQSIQDICKCELGIPFM